MTAQNSGSNNATPCIYTIANPIVLNYKGVVNNTTNFIGSANGPTVGGVTYSKIVTFAGVISSSRGRNPSQPNRHQPANRRDRGTTVISGANTYNGSTIVHSETTTACSSSALTTRCPRPPT